MSGASRRAPNILVLMSDQHNARFAGCAGNGLVRTPNLDRLAAGGMRFTSACCPSPLCVPSRMSFMTSRTPSRNRVWDNSHVLSSGIPTWAHVLGAAGYETALVGRMHFVGPDQRHGFERRPIGEYWAVHPGVPVKGGPEWVKFPASTSGQSRPSVEISGRGRTHYQWLDERVTDAACDYLREKAGSAGARPFAAVVGFVLPHCPYIAPKELFDRYFELVDVPPVETDQPATVLRHRRVRGILDPPLPERTVRVARAAYFGLCEHLDSLIGRILAVLDETGLSTHTLVVYTSDHGEMAGEHGCWWKSCYYEGSVAVPLMARLPGAIPPATVSDVVCNLTDLGPTFAEAAGAAPMPAVDGRSLWPIMRGETPPDRPNETTSELVDIEGREPLLPSRMIRSGRWKLWLFADAEDLPPALFDLEADPGETRDLGLDPAHAAVREELLTKLRTGWDPAAAVAGTLEASRDLRTLAAWGAAVRPDCPEALPVPPPELEEDVELL